MINVPPIQPAPVRSQALGSTGLFTPEFVLWFQQVLTTSQAVVVNTTNIAASAAQIVTLFAEVAAISVSLPPEVAQILASAMLATMLDLPRNWTPELDELRNVPVDSVRDFTPALDELRGRIAVEDPNRDFTRELDELRALLAAVDPSPMGALGSAAFSAASAYDVAGAAAAAIAALLAGSNTWNGALQTINSSITMWGQLVLKAAGMDWSAATIYGTGTFTGDMHFPFSNGFWYASPNATVWFEFRVITSTGAGVSTDFLGWQYNTRSTAGGVDVWLTAFQLNTLTGAVTFYTPTTFLGTVALPVGATLGGVAFGAAATASLPLSIANGGTSAITAAAALAALGGASLTGTQTFSGANTFSTTLTAQTVAVIGLAGGTAPSLNFSKGTSPVSGRIQFGTDGTGWQLKIGKNQGGTTTDYMTFTDAGAISTAAATSLSVGGSLCTLPRTVTTTDTALITDHTLIFAPTAAFTETLPASPLTGMEMYLVNANSGAFAVTVSGNGHNIWTLGTSAASISMAANTTAIIQFDGTLWRQIK